MGVVGTGREGYIGIAKETTWGTAVEPSTFLEFVSESITKSINPIVSSANINTRFKKDIYQGSIDISGGFSIEVNPDNIGLLIGATLGSESTAQVDTTTAYDHTFTPAGIATALPSLTIEVGRAIKQMRYSGCMVNSMKLSAAVNSILTAEFDILGKNEDDTVSAATPSYSSKKPYVYHWGTIKIDTTTVAYVKSFEFSYSNNLFADGYALDGNQTRAILYKQGAEITGTMDLEFTTDSYIERTAYLDNTDKALQLVFTSTETIESGYYYTITIDMPHVKYTKADANIGGPDAIPFSVDFEAVQPSISTAAITITLRDARTTDWSA